MVRESATVVPLEKRAGTGFLRSTFDIWNIDIDGRDESEADAVIARALLETGNSVY